jgi:UDP-N-acetylmuramoyl-tripeptide--D-alanyl-D-alanine ligase
MTSTEQLYELFQRYPKISTDTRKIEPGCLFFALKGERFDGNEFASKSLELGASFAIIDNPVFQTEGRCLLVDNVLTALQRLATYHRRQFQIPVIAIAGSNGKTTTKELVSAVLASHYPVHFTKGNFNNEIGVPLTLLQMPAGTEVAVIEIGANHLRETAFLCDIALPTHGLVTNCGKDHLEGFGSLEGVKKANGELYNYLAANRGMAFINADEPFLEELAARVHKKLLYGESETPSMSNPHYEVKKISVQPTIEYAFLSDKGELAQGKSCLFGEHNFSNVMTAVAIGKYFKVPASKIVAAIEGYVPTNNRSQIISHAGNTYIMDAYNANPSSMKKALEYFQQLKASPKIAILGAMLELGEYSDTEHEDIATLATGSGFEQVIFVGKEFRQAAANRNAPFFENTAALRAWFESRHFTGYTFLVKGSRSIGLEKLL